jgi:hypothetical protein
MSKDRTLFEDIEQQITNSVYLIQRKLFHIVSYIYHHEFKNNNIILKFLRERFADLCYFIEHSIGDKIIQHCSFSSSYGIKGYIIENSGCYFPRKRESDKTLLKIIVRSNDSGYCFYNKYITENYAFARIYNYKNKLLGYINITGNKPTTIKEIEMRLTLKKGKTVDTKKVLEIMQKQWDRLQNAWNNYHDDYYDDPYYLTEKEQVWED